MYCNQRQWSVLNAVTNPIPLYIPGVEYLASLFFLTSFCIICCWNWSFEGLSNSVLAQFSRRFLFRLKIASYFFHNLIYPIEFNTFRRQKWLFLFDLEVYTLRMRFFSFCFHLLNYSIWRGGTNGRVGAVWANIKYGLACLGLMHMTFRTAWPGHALYSHI